MSNWQYSDVSISSILMETLVDLPTISIMQISTSLKLTHSVSSLSSWHVSWQQKGYYSTATSLYQGNPEAPTNRLTGDVVAVWYPIGLWAGGTGLADHLYTASSSWNEAERVHRANKDHIFRLGKDVKSPQTTVSSDGIQSLTEKAVKFGHILEHIMICCMAVIKQCKKHIISHAHLNIIYYILVFKAQCFSDT